MLLKKYTAGGKKVTLLIKSCSEAVSLFSLRSCGFFLVCRLFNFMGMILIV